MSPLKTKSIVIIGAGLCGLASAALLARKGFKVTVVEQRNDPGGVAGSFADQGFTFDTGPTWYLMQEVFEDFFAHFGTSASQYYRLVDLDPSFKIFFGNGEQAVINRDIEHNKRIFEQLEPGGAHNLERYLAAAKYKYETALAEFLYREYTSIFQFFNRKMLLEGTKLHIFQKLDNYAKRFFKSSQARKILEYNIVFLGCTPYKSPALYSLMSHVDITRGVSYPMGGIHAIADGLHTLAKEQGAAFLFNHEVRSIIVDSGKTTGVETSQGFIPADIVLSTADYHHTETELLAPQWRRYSTRYWETRTLAPAVLLIFLGLNKRLHSLEHHNLYLSDKWQEHFITIFDRPAWPSNPSYYVGCPSRTDPSTAPPGCENLFILVPVAPGLDDTDDVRNRFADSIIDHLEQTFGQSIRDSIVTRRIMAHREFKAQHLYRGTALGLAHTLFQTAYFRPAHRSTKVSNLYFAGHYTHPGIGMPMVLIGSRVIADKIMHEWSE